VKIGMARIARLDHLLEIPAGDGGRLGGLLRSRRLCARADKTPDRQVYRNFSGQHLNLLSLALRARIACWASGQPLPVLLVGENSAFSLKGDLKRSREITFSLAFTLTSDILEEYIFSEFGTAGAERPLATCPPPASFQSKSGRADPTHVPVTAGPLRRDYFGGNVAPKERDTCAAYCPPSRGLHLGLTEMRSWPRLVRTLPKSSCGGR
jgi:hypothetical protein